MSIKAINWAWQQENLKPMEKVVLVALADHSDDNGICWPGINGIAEKCGASVRAVQSIIKTLSNECALIRTFPRYRKDGSQTSNFIVLNLRDLSFPEFLDPELQELLCITQANNKHSFTPPLPQPAPHPAQPAPLEPSLEPSLEPKPTTARKGPTETFTDDFNRFWGAYPSRSGDNPKRRAYKAWCARLREGVPAADMIAGAERYMKFCAETGRVGTEYVKQAATFLGPDKCYAEEWVSSGWQGNVKVDQWWSSESATEQKARELGIWPPKIGESWHDLRERIKAAM